MTIFYFMWGMHSVAVNPFPVVLRNRDMSAPPLAVSGERLRRGNRLRRRKYI